MKRKSVFILLLLIFNASLVWGQQNLADSLRAVINLQKGDTAEVNALVYLGNEQTLSDSAIIYAQQGLLLAQKINYKKGEADCFFVIGRSYVDFSGAIQYALIALDIYEDLHNSTGIASAHLILQGSYWVAGDYKNALIHAFSGEQVAEANAVKGIFVFPGHRLAPLFLAEIGQIYVLRNQLDSALFYTQRSIDQKELFNGVEWGFPVYLLAAIQTMQGNYKLALENYRLSIPLSIQNGFARDTLQIFSGLSTLFKKTGDWDSSIYYAQKVAVSWNTKSESEPKNLVEAVDNLAFVYKLKGNKDSTLKYIELNTALKDSFYSKEKDRELQNITFNERMKQQEIIAAQLKYKNKVQLLALAFGLFTGLLIVGLLWRNNIHRQKAYALLQKQKGETDFQKMKVEQALEELKSTQSQLVQREKMASLGELTAGIAHEIQNPLNFVNNFSEVNSELIDELEQEIDKGNLDDAKAIAKDIKENEEKINHHGKRADAIVKGMLQHSRSSSGVKEPTDINALADEYLRLAYHGLRAKDKSFNATMKTDFDESIGTINIIPQDIGRVILNLITNAFYAVKEKNASASSAGQPYEPTVSLSTKKVNDKVEIKVKDNGNGVPQKVLDKIFQPFFTTKPSGQGTGLGLSLAYDIVKAHGGELKVETKEGEGSEFIIQLPNHSS